MCIRDRFRSLNSLHSFFDGELSPYMAGATNIKGIILANAGVNGPWAPLGYFYYLPIYLNNLFFGSSTFSVRLASAQISLVTIILAYFLGKKIHSKLVGLISATFISLDPIQIFWARTDIHPHGATVWISLLIAIYLITKNKNKLVLLLLMALSFHQ